MRCLNFILALFIIAALPAWVHACPSCADAPAATSGSSDDDAAKNQAAYNNSIYVMVGVPYLSFGVLAFMIYRGVKKNDEFRRAHGWPQDQDPQAPVGDAAGS